MTYKLIFLRTDGLSAIFELNDLDLTRDYCHAVTTADFVLHNALRDKAVRAKVSETRALVLKVMAQVDRMYDDGIDIDYDGIPTTKDVSQLDDTLFKVSYHLAEVAHNLHKLK
jgi:hypothetical protein